MESISYKGLFNDREMEVATNVIARFMKQWKCLKREGFDDLRQECLFKWYRVKGRYNPLFEASQWTFMAVVIKNELLHKVEKLTPDMRKASAEAVSLNERISEEEGAPTYLDQLSAKEDSATDPRATIWMKIDVAEALRKLTSKQRKLCRLLGEGGLNIKEASEALKTPRGTLYEDVNRIGVILEETRVRDYLK